MHFWDALVECFRACDFSQHLKEASLSSAHKRLDLALLDNLILTWGVQAESARLE